MKKDSVVRRVPVFIPFAKVFAGVVSNVYVAPVVSGFKSTEGIGRDAYPFVLI